MQSNGIGFDRESTLALLPFSNQSPPDDDRGAASEVESVENFSSDTFANDTTFHLRLRHETPRALAENDEPYQGIPIFTDDFTTNEKGWWKRQMLVDRSLRSMAALTSIFALIMVVTCASHFRDFVSRTNKNSTSVGGRLHSCGNIERQDVVSYSMRRFAAATN